MGFVHRCRTGLSLGAAVAVALFGAAPEPGPVAGEANRASSAPAPAATATTATLPTATLTTATPTTAPAAADGAGDVTLASATSTLVPPADSGVGSLPLEQVRAATLERISYPWQERLPGWIIEFLPGRDGYLGATWSRERRIEIYVRPGQGVDELAFTLAHELGHAVDVTHFDGEDRDRWLAARGVSGARWWTDSGEGDYAVGAGDFAESFAVWQVGGTSLSNLAGPVSAAELAVLAELVNG